MEHAINLTHDGTLIVRVPKGYKVDKVVVEEMGTENRVEYQPTHPTPSNTLGALDCVERQAAMKIRFSSGFDHDGILFIPYRDVEEHLKKLPSVQPRTGKWVYEGIRGRFPVCSCSVCGSKENADWAIMQGANFCPNCGADMRDDSDDQQEESETRKYMEYGKLIAKGIAQGLRGEHDDN